MFDGGIYAFLLRLRSPSTLVVGALGEHHFPAGWYLYTGRAKKNLAKRVERHWSLKTKLRWHFDYLTTALDSEPIGAIVIPSDVGLSECQLNRTLGHLVGNQVPVPKFGASDCLAGCPAHLYFSRAPISLLALAQAHKQAGILMPSADFWEPNLFELGRS